MMRAQVITEAKTVVITHGQRMIYMPVVYPDGYLRMGICPTCGDLPEGCNARICTRSDCGLANRRHDVAHNDVIPTEHQRNIVNFNNLRQNGAPE